MQDKRGLPKYFLILFLLVLLIVFSYWLFFTPPGLEGKLGAIGYAVCHQIPERSFTTSHGHSPLCARCTGMYLCAFVTLIFQSFRGRRSAYPLKQLYPLMGIFLLAFAVDGANSYAQFFRSAPMLYPPNNLFRVLTGSGMGVNIGLLVYPIFHQTLWTQIDTRPAVKNWLELLLISIISLSLSYVAYLEIATLSDLFAYISIGTVLLVLSMVFTSLMTLIFHKENTFKHWKDAFPMVVAGLAATFTLILLLDWLRFRLTGVWTTLF